jgi:membrane-associated phospholipid phosphatase
MRSVTGGGGIRLRPDRPWWDQRWRAILAGFAVSFAAGLVFASFFRAAGRWDHGLVWERALMVRVHEPLPAMVDATMVLLPWFGTNISLIPAIAILAWWLWAKRGRPHLAIRLATVQLGSYLLNPSLKGMYGRARPDLFPHRGWFGWTSYPSGHAIASISVLLTVAIVLHLEFGWRWPFPVAVALLGISAYGRMYLGVHWPTDVIGGAVVGIVWLAATSYAFRDRRNEGR